MIYAKLLEFQKLNITIEKDAVNPHFKNSYSSLNEVLSKVKKPLNDMGVIIVQSPMVTPTGSFLTTLLIDSEDRSQIESLTPFVNTTDMQKLGGAITYARRYSLIAMLGLEDEDDDGNTASKELPTINRR
jgi:hypothetical protein